MIAIISDIVVDVNRITCNVYQFIIQLIIEVNLKGEWRGGGGMFSNVFSLAVKVDCVWWRTTA